MRRCGNDDGHCAATLLAVLALGWASHAGAQAIVNPDWERKPSGDEFSDAYPPMAAALGIEGRAQVACRVTAEGVLSNCRVLAEAPKGQGFGPAAIELTHYFRMTPKMADGRGVGGGMVRIPLHFRLPQPQVTPFEPGPPTSADALVQARRLVATEHLLDRFSAHIAPGAPMFAQWPREGLTAETRADGEAAMRQAFDEISAPLAESAARAYAAVLTDDQIQAAQAFAASPSGQAEVRRAADLDALNAPLAWVTTRAGIIHARELFCASRDCTPDSEFETKLPSRSPPSVVTADWVQQPERWQFFSNGPWVATLMSLSGQARLRCKVVATGALQGCQVLGETPKGLGYGASALILAGFYRMQPLPPGGGPATVELGINFPEAPVLPPPFPAQPAIDPQPSEARRELGRSLAEVSAERGKFEVNKTNNLAFFDKLPLTGMEPAARADARAALIAGMVEAQRLKLAGRALDFAGLFSEVELKDMIAWELSPAGQARQAHEAELAEMERERNASFSSETYHRAGRIFCAAHDCDSTLAPISAAPKSP